MQAIKVSRSFASNLTIGAGAGIGAYISLNPQDTDSFASDFGNTFQLFRLDSAMIRWTPGFTNFPLTSGSALAPHPMYTAFSSTVAAAPTTLSQLLQYGTLKVRTLVDPWSQNVSSPSVTMSAYHSGSSAYSYVPARSQWFAVGSPSPQFNGMLVWVDDCGVGASTFLGQFTITLHFTLKGLI